MTRARQRLMVKLTATAAMVAAAMLTAATPALAQGGPGNPFSTIPQESATIPSQTASAPAVSTVGATTPGSGGLSSGAGVGIGIGALVVLGGIALFIWRDARRRAPVRAAAAGAAPGGGKAGSKARTKPRKLSPAERRRRKRGRAR